MSKEQIEVTNVESNEMLLENPRSYLTVMDEAELALYDDLKAIDDDSEEEITHALLVMDKRELILRKENQFVTPRKEEDIQKKAVFVSRTGLTIAEKKENLLKLRSYLEKDFKAADIKWSLFVAACQSHRHSVVVQPFPPAFIKKNNLRDMDHLYNVIIDTPPLTILLKRIRDIEKCKVDEIIIDLLVWLFIVIKYPYLETLETECFKSVLSRVPSRRPIPKPDFIFEVVTSTDTPAEKTWNNLCCQYSTHFGYHGSNLENFHCIIHYGLLRHLNKYSQKKRHLEGKGVYLSNELSAIVPYTTTGYTWGASRIGSHLSCVALCEYFLNDEFLKVKESVELFGCKRNLVESEKANLYHVITDADMVRVRYLLIYRKPEKEEKPVQPWITWCIDHKKLTCVILYVVFVLIVMFYYYCNKLLDRFGLLVY